ncbi:hypothetical protein ACLIRA_006324, partial [Pseudomonas aeruginosa]
PADGAQSATLIATVATPEKATPRVAFFVSTIERADAAGQRPAEGNMGGIGKSTRAVRIAETKKGPEGPFLFDPGRNLDHVWSGKRVMH